MPYPYTKYRSRNRTRVNNRIPPLVASVGGPSSGDASSATVTFPTDMDTTITAIPPGFTIDNKQVIIIGWSSPTVMNVTTGFTFTAGDLVVFPATNVLRSASGGNVQASTFAMAA